MRLLSAMRRGTWLNCDLAVSTVLLRLSLVFVLAYFIATQTMMAVQVFLLQVRV